MKEKPKKYTHLDFNEFDTVWSPMFIEAKMGIDGALKKLTKKQARKRLYGIISPHDKNQESCMVVGHNYIKYRVGFARLYEDLVPPTSIVNRKTVSTN